MTDQVFTGCNRVPGPQLCQVLQLIGVRLFPPRPARRDHSFLAGPQPATSISAPVRRWPRPHDSDEAVAFTTVGDLPIVPTR